MKNPTPHAIRKVFRRTHDPIWQLQGGIVAIMILQYFTNDSFLPYDKYVIILFEAIALFGLAIATSDGYHRVSHIRRTITLALIILVAIINIFSLIFLVQALLSGGEHHVAGNDLLFNAMTIYITNIFMFALLYWEMDGGGPDHRVVSEHQRDFVFPQQLHKHIAKLNWLPGFTDYLYLSTTNVTNFASADTVPISHRAKLLMMVQALVSVIAVVLVAARAIGVLQ
ncbi:MAG TPA: hypothetical protein VF281_00245 [Candidatus Saccharimonadales bacterium]